ncbi:MAG: PEP-utilizing enzyme [Patescibacteria group bacterium]
MRINKKTKYRFQWGEQQSMLSSEFWVKYWGAYYLGKPKCTDYIVASEKKYLDTYASVSMLNEIHSRSNAFLKKKNRIRYFKRSKLQQRKYWLLFQRLQGLELDKLSDIQIAEFLSRYVDLVQYISALFVMSDDKGLFAVTRKVQAMLREKGMFDILSLVTTPCKTDIFINELRDLKKLKHRKKIKRNDLLNHTKKHAWLFFNSYNTSENILYIKNRLGESLNLKKKLNNLKQLCCRQKLIFNKMNDAELHDLCFFMQHMGLDRLQLKNCWAGAEFRFLDLFLEISKRIDVKFLAMMAGYRFQDYLEALIRGKKVSRNTLSRRLKKYILWKKNDTMYFSDSQIEVKNILNHLRRGVIEKTHDVKGVPANPGVRRGICRLVRSVDIHQVLVDMKRFKKGEILVTWMTQPNMVPIVRKAAAIIADEGGIMSHAAVIAREFGIPCIVGAHNATKILKDGDRVDVDAFKGIIRKI